MSFRSEPFLWIHAAGLVASPICLGLCFLALTTDHADLPTWLELCLIGLLGAGPILWMQLARPFYIFSVTLVSVQPDGLTEEQCRILSRFKSAGGQIPAILAALFLLSVLWAIYPLAAQVPIELPFPTGGRLVSLTVAIGFFFLANLFLQVPISVFRVLLTQPPQWEATLPYPLEQIRHDFTIPGFWLQQILPGGSPKRSS